VAGFIFAAFEGGIESGWLPRTREVVMYVRSEQWMMGEQKTCYSFSTKEKTDLDSLYCETDPKESHALNVKFWGAISTERDKIWKCERQETSVVCKLQ
jgi:hypothetical protein